MATITALIHTKNSASTLAKCLTSVAFVDQVIVVDMESSDQTLNIAKQHDSIIFKHPDVGYVEPARNFGLKKVKTDWTLILDSDEEVPSTLAQHLKKLMAEESSADAYYLPRRNIVFNKWIQHTGWWPDFQLRFFKTGKVEWPAQIHAQPVIHGQAEKLPLEEELALTHHNYQTVEQFIERLNRYTTIEVDRGQSTADSFGKHTAQALPAAFSQEFARRFFAEDGFRDGKHGLALAYLQSMYQVIVELKKWQAAGFPDSSSSNTLVKEVDASLKELHYWVAGYAIQRSTGMQKLWWMIRRKLRW